MKKIGLFASLILMGNMLFAQSINDGKQFLNYERYESAEGVFQKLLASDPNNIEAAYWLGQTYLEDQDIVDTTKAKVLYQKMLQANPNNPLLMVGIGQVELRDGDTTDARNRFETAINLTKKRDRDAIQEAVGRANVLTKNGNILYGIDMLNQAADRDKKNPEIYNLIGHGYWRLNDGSNAIINYQKALALDSKDARAEWMIGRIYETQGYGQQTIYMKHYLDAIQEDPNFAPVYYWLYGYYYNRDVNTAAEYLDKYIAHADKESKNCYAQTSLMLVSSKYQETVTQANSCIAAAGEKAYPNLYGLKGYAYDKLGDSLKAKEAFEQYFAKVNPDNIGPKDYATYGRILLKFPGQQALADSMIDKAIAMDTVMSKKIGYIKDVAQSYVDSKNYLQAGKWFGKVLSIDTAYGKVDLFYAGYNDYRGGNYVTADSVFKLYQQKYPDDILGWYLGGHAAEGIDTSNTLGLAKPDYEKVIAIADTTKDKASVNDKLIPALRYMLAYYYNIKHNTDSAIYYNDQILVADPTDATALQTKTALAAVQKQEQEAANKAKKP
ncbi:MAG TPA: tetratricopeptide repeat protein [Hanamia sp.]|nr:tetratricopeptide repeat protein [Hanamia sp.]